MKRPYDAEHVQIVDHGCGVITAVWIADPELSKDPAAALENHWADWDVVTVAEAVRHYKTQGADFSGWIVTDHRGNYGTEPIRRKPEAMAQLRDVIRDHFNR